MAVAAAPARNLLRGRQPGPRRRAGWLPAVPEMMFSFVFITALLKAFCGLAFVRAVSLE
jgi:hypothetical protein